MIYISIYPRLAISRQFSGTMLQLKDNKVMSTILMTAFARQLGLYA
jgi:hypothetical protein